MKEYADHNKLLDINKLVSRDEVKRPPRPASAWSADKSVKPAAVKQAKDEVTAFGEAVFQPETSGPQGKPNPKEAKVVGMLKKVQQFFAPDSEAPAKPVAGKAKARESKKTTPAPKDRPVAAKTVSPKKQHAVRAENVSTDLMGP